MHGCDNWRGALLTPLVGKLQDGYGGRITWQPPAPLPPAPASPGGSQHGAHPAAPPDPKKDVGKTPPPSPRAAAAAAAAEAALAGTGVEVFRIACMQHDVLRKLHVCRGFLCMQCMRSARRLATELLRIRKMYQMCHADGMVSIASLHAGL